MSLKKVQEIEANRRITARDIYRTFKRVYSIGLVILCIVLSFLIVGCDKSDAAEATPSGVLSDYLTERLDAISNY